jgi:RNA polymerase sigma factor (sigma-70 family)
MPPDPFADAEELLRRVYAYVAYRVRNRAEAEDITSEAFERALRYRQTYDPAKGESIGWLLGIARRCIYDAASKAASAGQPPEPETQAAIGDPAAAVLPRLELGAALARLAERDRDLLALRYGADLSTHEIGRLLDMKPNAVDVAVSRARSQLRRLLDAPIQDEPAALPNTAQNRL